MGVQNSFLRQRRRYELEFLNMTRLVAEPGFEEFTVRGRSKRTSSLKELFQTGVITTIASAAGCTAITEQIDTGIDLIVTQELTGMGDRRTINLQLKCTEVGSPGDKFVNVKVSKNRYNEYRFVGKHEPLILVAQLVSPKQEEWVDQSGRFTNFFARNYWQNLTGYDESSVADDGDVTVKVPTTNVFDDEALIRLFAEYRKGVLKL